MLGAMAPDEQLQLVSDWIGQRTRRVLGLSGTQLAADSSLANVGMDSLMSVELKIAIEREFAVNLPMTVLLR
jgi:acyl carrier protein